MNRRWIWIAAVLPLASACASVLGLDAFKRSDGDGAGGSGAVDEGGPGADTGAGGTGAADAAADGADGPASSENPCAADEVPVGGGSCEHVGITTCKDGFSTAADGACRVLMPDADCPSGLAFPGSDRCDQLACTTPDGYPPIGTRDPSSITYVDPAATCTSPDGTKSCPFQKIADALQSPRLSSGGTLFLHKGKFQEDVTIATSNVEIRGCSTQLEGGAATLDPASPCYSSARPAARGATVCVAPGVTASIDGVTVTGKGYGILVHGGSVSLSSSSIVDTASYGLLVQEAKTRPSPGSEIKPAGATLKYVSILRAGGVGIQVEGSSLTVEQSSIQNTTVLGLPPSAPDARATGEDRIGLARGIALYPSSWSKSASSTDPADFVASVAHIELTAITGNGEIGVYVAGATPVSISQSFIGGLPNGTAAGRGLVVERSPANGAPADVTVDSTVIEGTRDAAVDVRDATVSMTETTIRDTRGRLGDGCSGQGVRVRSVGDAPSEVTLDHVSVLESRQSAVFAASSTVTLTRTLLADIHPKPEDTPGQCLKAMGDGLVVESYPQLRADVTLDRVRIDRAQRAGVFAGDGEISASSSLVACSSSAVVDAATTSRAGKAFGALCGCGSQWVDCAFEQRDLDSWAVAGASPAWPDHSDVASICAVDFTKPERAISSASVWNLLAPELVPVVIPAQGCAYVPGLGPGWSNLALAKPGFHSFSHPIYFPDAHLGIFGPFSTAPLASAYAKQGWPIGAPLVEFVAPAGSTLTLGPGEVMTTLDGQLLPDGVMPGLPGRVGQGLLWTAEGGWHSVAITPSAGFTCVSDGPEGTSATSIPVHVFPGLTPSVVFDCTVSDCSVVINQAATQILEAPNPAKESALGNLVADCMRDAMKTQLAVVNLGAISGSGSIDAGDVTWCEVFGLLPFPDKVSRVTLTAAEVVSLLNEQWLQTTPRFLAVSGFTYVWDDTLPPGQKVVEVRDAQGALVQPSDNITQYTVALPDYLAQTAAGFTVLQNKTLSTAPGEQQLEAQMFGTCIASLPTPFTSTIEGRIQLQ